MLLWAIEYADQVRNYFVDNSGLTGNLLGEIERLRYAPDGLPGDNYTRFAPGYIEWEVLGHLVFYRLSGDLMEVLAVKPL